MIYSCSKDKFMYFVTIVNFLGILHSPAPYNAHEWIINGISLTISNAHISVCDSQCAIRKIYRTQSIPQENARKRMPTRIRHSRPTTMEVRRHTLVSSTLSINIYGRFEYLNTTRFYFNSDLIFLLKKSKTKFTEHKYFAQ